MRTLALAVTGLLFAFPVAAQQTLVLRNGDRLSGRVTAITGTTWVFRHGGGELKVPAAQIVGYTTGSPIGVRLSDGTITAAAVRQTGDRLELVPTNGTARTIAPEDLAAIGGPDDLRALEPVRVGYFSPLSKFWSATTGFGFSSKSGNSRSRGFAGDLQVTRVSPKDRLALDVGLATTFSEPPGADTLAKVVEKYFGSLRADVFFSRRLFVFGSTRQERDKFQGIDLRSNYTGGLGVQVLATAATDFRLYGSGGYRREAFVTDSVFGTAVLGAGGALKQVLGPAVFAWNVDWTPSADNLEDYRFISSASLTTTVFRGLGFRIASRNELNNNPPAGVEKHDWLLTTTLTYTVGR